MSFQKICKIFGICLLISFTACSSAPSVPETTAAPAKIYDAATFYKTTALAGASISHDDRFVLYSSDASGVFNVYRQPVGGGKAVQLTHSKSDARFAVSWFPRDSRFLFSSNTGGNELDHIFAMEKNGKTRDLTPGAKTKAQFLGWSRDKKSFWVITNERDPRAFDVYSYSAKDYARKLIFQNDAFWLPGLVSGDGRWLALSRVNDNYDTDVYVQDLRDLRQAPRQVTEGMEKTTGKPFAFSFDSAKLFFGSDAESEFTQAWEYDLKQGTRRLVHKADWDIENYTPSENGRFTVVRTNEDAQVKLVVKDNRSGNSLALPQLPAGEITSLQISNSENIVAFYINSETSSPNLYVLELKEKKLHQLTKSMNPQISESDLVAGQVVRYPSFDGLSIPAILYRPKGASRKHPAPAMLWIHGGPGGQTRLGYSPIIQHLVNQGYAILSVNNRGSSGYGKTFYHLDDHRHGDADLDDCVWAKHYLASLDWIDSKRVGIMGGSYGGYMTVAALTFRPEVFTVGINIFGVTNWIRTLQSVPPWWASFRNYLISEIGDPEKDIKYLNARSPLLHAKNIRRPLLVVQGKNDPRVLQVESDEIVAAVRKNQVPVDYLVFPDEGHGFRRKENSIRASEAFAEFLKKYL